MVNQLPKTYLLYDGECPFCSSVSHYYQVKNALPGLQIISMRDSEAVKNLHLPANIDFNQGMVLIKPDGTILQGEAAFLEINQKTDISGLKDFFIVGVNSRPWITRLVYPIFFQLRKLVLKVKGVPEKIERSDLN